jgi:hypothetical protein
MKIKQRLKKIFDNLKDYFYTVFHHKEYVMDDWILLEFKGDIGVSYKPNQQFIHAHNMINLGHIKEDLLLSMKIHLNDNDVIEFEHDLLDLLFNVKDSLDLQKWNKIDNIFCNEFNKDFNNDKKYKYTITLKRK